MALTVPGNRRLGSNTARVIGSEEVVLDNKISTKKVKMHFVRESTTV